MKCKACNGTGVLVAPIYENDEIGFVDKTYQCYCCRGSGVIKQTNEEWFCQLPTEEKAKVIVDLGREQHFPKDVEVEFCEQWLKEEHKYA